MGNRVPAPHRVVHIGEVCVAEEPIAQLGQVAIERTGANQMAAKLPGVQQLALGVRLSEHLYLLREASAHLIVPHARARTRGI